MRLRDFSLHWVSKQPIVCTGQESWDFSVMELPRFRVRILGQPAYLKSVPQGVDPGMEISMRQVWGRALI